MTSIILIILFVMFAVVLWVVLRIRFSSKEQSLSQLESAIIAVDAVALGNLLHGSEDAFLRQNLAPRKYRQIKRKRVRAARQYVWNISQNAAVLSRIAGLALDSGDPQIQATAQKLAKDAVELRWSALRAYCLLVVQEAYPSVDLSSIKVRDRYTNVAESASWLYRLRFPESRLRISAALCG